MRLLHGNLLSDATRRQVLAAFVYRRFDSTSKTDAEWLAKHAFYVRRDGMLSRAHKSCVPSYMAEYGQKIKPEECTATVHVFDRDNLTCCCGRDEYDARDKS